MLKYLLAIFIISAAASSALAWDTYVGRSLDGRVIDVPASNILTVDADGKKLSIRFYGIGVPTPRQPFGNEAHALLRSILAPGTKVIMTTVNEEEDGVINALVQVQDHSINNRLVSEGLAWVDRSTCKAFFCRRWHIEEHIAQKDRRGVWSMNYSTPPWQWGEAKK